MHSVMAAAYSEKEQFSSMDASVSSARSHKCMLCVKQQKIMSPNEFYLHLREFHCTKEGGSFICRYGLHDICSSLPLEGVSDKDYEDHVIRDHVRVSGSKSHAKSSTFQPKQPNIVPCEQKWTVHSFSQNLPAALNDPGRTRREMLDFFTRTWGVNFLEIHEIGPSPYIPLVDREDFEHYLKKNAARYRRHLHNNKHDKTAEKSKDDEYLALLQNKNKEAAELARSADLEQIPKIFTQQNFQLSDPDTFRQVLPWNQLESPTKSDHRSKQTGRLLQEKLAHYLDIVEVHLAKMISLRSDAFFHAMTSHDELQTNMLDTCQAIKHLRDKIQSIDKVLVEGPLKIMKLTCRRNNIFQIYKKLKLVATVHQTQPTIQLLLSTSEFVGALDLISTTQEVLNQEMIGIVSFRHLGSQLSEMENLIDKMMKEDFVRYIAADLTRPLLPDEYDVLDEDRLVAILCGLLRQKQFRFVRDFRAEAADTIKAVIKQTVIEIISEVDDADAEGTAISVSDQLRLLPFDSWLSLLAQVFNNTVLLLMRIKALVLLMCGTISVASGMLNTESADKAAEFLLEEDADYINGIDEDESQMQEGALASLSSLDAEPAINVPLDNTVEVMLTHLEREKLMSDLREMLCSLCNYAHDRCAKLLSVKTKEGALERMSSQEFLELSRCIEKFSVACRDICGRKSTSLHSALQCQADKFVNKFHEERKNKLGLILDNERWKQADVPAEFQELVNDIHETGEFRLLEKPNGNEKKPSEYLFVGSEKFVVVGTVLMLLKIVMEYCDVVRDMPSVSMDIMTRLVELLKLFNSRSCQLVLGAGALQLVGLKTITTKNLALASRCLQLMVHYIPLIRKQFEQTRSSKNAIVSKHFDHVLKDYLNHIEEIETKLVAIMEFMIDQQLEKWEAKPPIPSAGMRSTCKQILKLHEAINELLPREQLTSLFLRVNESFKLRFKTRLLNLSIQNDGGPQHAMVTSDIAFYCGQMKALAYLSDEFNNNTINVWDNS